MADGVAAQIGHSFIPATNLRAQILFRLAVSTGKKHSLSQNKLRWLYYPCETNEIARVAGDKVVFLMKRTRGSSSGVSACFVLISSVSQSQR